VATAAPRMLVVPRDGPRIAATVTDRVQVLIDLLCANLPGNTSRRVLSEDRTSLVTQEARPEVPSCVREAARASASISQPASQMASSKLHLLFVRDAPCNLRGDPFPSSNHCPGRRAARPPARRKAPPAADPAEHRATQLVTQIGRSAQNQKGLGPCAR